VPKFPEYYSYTYAVPCFIVGFGVKLSFFFFGSVYLYKKLNYVNCCVVRMLLEVKPTKVLLAEWLSGFEPRLVPSRSLTVFGTNGGSRFSEASMGGGGRVLWAMPHLQIIL